MTVYAFDDRNLRWHVLPDIDYLSYSILCIDSDRGIVDVLFKFAANQQISIHRHLVQNNMLVLQGEHRIYDAAGRLTETRPAGQYTVSPPSEVPHREGGGDQDAIVYFSIRSDEKTFYELLDERQEVTATLGLEDFIGLFEAQQAANGNTP